MPHNQPNRWQSLITLFILMLLASYILSCVSPTLKKPPGIKIPETSAFECIRQYDRVNVLAARPPWTMTDITIQEGDKVLIFASGAATLSRGTKRFKNTPPYNSLQLMIGTEGTPEAAVMFNNLRYFKPYEIGKLMLAVKDWRNPSVIDWEWYKDNTGEYLVDLFVVTDNKEELLFDAMQELRLHNPEDHLLIDHINKFIELHRNLFLTDVEVTSSPPNTQVFIDSFYIGKTPITLQDLKVHRTYEICLRREGYPDYCHSLSPKKSKNLFVELKKEYDKVSAVPKELNEIKKRLNEEKKKVTLLEEKLKTEADIKKRLEDSLIEREDAIKRQSEVLTQLYEKERQLKEKLFLLQEASRQAEDKKREIEALKKKSEALDRKVKQKDYKTKTSLQEAKRELNSILEAKVKLEKEAEALRTTEERLKYEVRSLRVITANTRQEANEANSELSILRKREERLNQKLNELKKLLNRKLAPIVVISQPKDATKYTDSTAYLHLIVVDEKGISSVNVFLNGLPIQLKSNRGILLAELEKAATNSNKLEIKERFQLQEGRNTILVQIEDTDGMRTEETVTVYLEKKRGRIYAVVVGINDYLNARKLKYAVNDATAFKNYLRSNIKIPEENIFLLTDKHATKDNIQKLLGTQIKRRASKEDTVIIFYAGHGAVEPDPSNPDGDGFEKYLLPYDADLDDLYTSSISMDEITKIFQRIQAERLIFIGDTCYSGAAGGRTALAYKARANLSEKFLDRISKGKGRVIISSCSANEVSKEDDGLQHGVFSYYLLEGLKGKADRDSDGIITITEIFGYLSHKVPKVTGQDQHPVKKGITEGELVIGYVK